MHAKHDNIGTLSEDELSSILFEDEMENELIGTVTEDEMKREHSSTLTGDEIESELRNDLESLNAPNSNFQRVKEETSDIQEKLEPNALSRSSQPVYEAAQTSTSNTAQSDQNTVSAVPLSPQEEFVSRESQGSIFQTDELAARPRPVSKAHLAKSHAQHQVLSSTESQLTSVTEQRDEEASTETANKIQDEPHEDYDHDDHIPKEADEENHGGPSVLDERSDIPSSSKERTNNGISDSPPQNVQEPPSPHQPPKFHAHSFPTNIKPSLEEIFGTEPLKDLEDLENRYSKWRLKTEREAESMLQIVEDVRRKRNLATAAAAQQTSFKLAKRFSVPPWEQSQLTATVERVEQNKANITDSIAQTSVRGVVRDMLEILAGDRNKAFREALHFDPRDFGTSGSRKRSVAPASYKAYHTFQKDFFSQDDLKQLLPPVVQVCSETHDGRALEEQTMFMLAAFLDYFAQH
jgi:hypothetical protein